MFYRDGFTLIELIIVIIVIGILASIALPRYQRIAEKSRVAEAKNILSTIRSAQLTYYAQYGAYCGADISPLDVTIDNYGTNYGKYFRYWGRVAAIGGLVGVATRRTDVEYYLGNATGYSIYIDENGAISMGGGYSQYGYLL
ncbi:MAG: prepilin-type N-terminal cleavage/methylation domain-containing protein [Candidatus Omnitrophica bacterium]|nr:prepilin-type N-terminal cleavage/methylation domain-containing protein [Candidatus Omnitrophota bacterium]MDD5352571.1 prepilin-type N-terminal cleavage/methylation domain-containing protein [Candidatus Omnitrophota bacterium]MDD5550169.1 prepilin-type N-terminal cleavage/methylation domain-containing protein [Candidatus Omnitrophota bacterium]